MGVVGAALRGFGKALKKSKKAAPRRYHYQIKPGLYIKQFKKSKKHGLGDKIGVHFNRESGKMLTQMGSGVNVKFKKSGMPHVPKFEETKGALKRGATRLKGWAKLTSPLAAAGTALVIRDKVKGKKNGNKK